MHRLAMAVLRSLAVPPRAPCETLAQGSRALPEAPEPPRPPQEAWPSARLSSASTARAASCAP